MLFSQVSLAQDGYFEQGYGGETDEGGKAVYVNPDHSIIMVGFKQVSSTNRDILIVKTDSLGDTLWTKTLGGSQDDEALSLIRDRNGNYVLTGYTASSGMGGKDIYVASFTDAGAINWEQTYGTSYDEKAEGIIQLPGSGSPYFALVGTKVLSSTDEDVVVLKINATGTQQWITSVGGTGIQQGKAITIVNIVDTIPGTGDSLAISGTEFPTGSSNTIGFIATIGFDGNSGGYFSYPTLGNTAFYSLAFYSGSLYVAGQLTSTGNDVNGLLLKTNTKGEVIYSNDYGGDETDVFYHLINFSGSMVATGFTESTGEGDKDMWQCFIEEDGTLHKEIRYGGEGTDIGYHSFLRGSDLYTVGYKNSFGIITSGNIYLTRANLSKWVCNYPSYPDGSMPNYWLETVQLDCSMKRILMVRDMFTGIPSNYYICKWCTSFPSNPDHLNINSIPVTDITNS
ncbi:MAG: hypothetical protein IT247_00580, partial [Bacteroidia bacterium]|nr:hypothetical protein [Bacteroidia bacterium]